MMINWELTFSNLINLALAYALALPIGLEWERHARSAGLRTFPLVAVAACGYMLLGKALFTSEESQARVMFGIITGMGFIGGGAILKGEKVVTGTSTAASLWNTGAIGMAVAWQRYDIAIILSLVNFLTLRYITFMKNRFKNSKRNGVESESDYLD